MPTQQLRFGHFIPDDSQQMLLPVGVVVHVLYRLPISACFLIKIIPVLLQYAGFDQIVKQFGGVAWKRINPIAGKRNFPGMVLAHHMQVAGTAAV